MNLQKLKANVMDLIEKKFSKFLENTEAKNFSISHVAN